MGSYYLVELADWLRDAGLRVVECDGWQYRSRSSGGYEPGRPWAVFWHHTASATGGSAANDVAYMLSENNPNEPTANLYVARDGEVWVMAGGATNTNGKGDGYRSTSKGVIPVDSANTYVVGIEIGNNGVGEPYSKECIDASFATSITVTNHLGLLPTDVITHQAYAPDRKVDPATCTAVQGGWYPSPVTGSGTWSLDDLKAECARRAVTGGGESEDDMPLTDADVAKIWAAMPLDRISQAVWAHEIDTTAKDAGIEPQAARYWLQRAFLIAREYLGPFPGKAATDPSMLKEIHREVTRNVG